MSTFENDELIYLLKHGRSAEAAFYCEAQERKAYTSDFPAFMEQMLQEYHCSRKNVAVRSGLSQDYTYKLLRGAKRTGERDYIIAMCMAIGMNLAQTQHALRCYNMPLLDRRDLRSDMIYIAIQEGISIDKLNEWLEKAGFPYLKVSPDMPSAEVRLIFEEDEIPTKKSCSSCETEDELDYDDKYEVIEKKAFAEMEPCAQAPMDYWYWGELSLKDDRERKFYLQAAYTSFGTSLIVMNEEQHRRAGESGGEFVETIESYEGLEEAGGSEFFRYFLELDKLTDEKVRETMESVDDTRNYGLRVNSAISGGKRRCYLEYFNSQNPADLEYLQILYEEGTYTYSASRRSYFMQMELGDIYPLYFGKKPEQEYFLKVSDPSEIPASMAKYVLPFRELRYTMHEWVRENGGFVNFDSEDSGEETIEILAQRAAVAFRSGEYEESIRLNSQVLELTQKNSEQNLLVEILCYYKIAACYEHLGDVEKVLEYWKKAYDSRDRIQESGADGEELLQIRRTIGTIAGNLGQFYMGQGNSEEVVRYTKTCIELLENNCETKEEWISLFSAYLQYTVFTDSDDPEQACTYYRRAIAVVRDQNLTQVTGCKIAASTLYNNYAWVLWNAYSSEEAVIYYGQSIDLLEGYLSHKDLDREAVIDHLDHTGGALMDIYRSTGKIKEMERLIRRLEEDGVHVEV